MFQVLPMLAEVLRLRDSSMMSLELTGLVTKYPDMRPEQLVNLLMCRGDLSRADARQIVSDTIGEDDPQKKRPLGIFTEIPS
ncbi:exocyst complex component 3-like [Crassostrea angulata]|nr:exocyst complex component 3-like [Crassostrea angulata]|eukprot:XP_011455508.1 PREDICTED: exocyst complex component 3-like [Crassostrea gigas]